jgi:Domain of unknown function (DUF4184)
MPFTLAHPAAVLPFRRWCPRYFNFPALVIGSLCPDAGYGFGSENMDVLSHSMVGSVEFCLPVGVVMLAFFYGLRLTLIEMLPESSRKIFRASSQRPMGSPLIVIISLLVGIWIHLLLDSFTHKNGWLVQNFPLLQTAIFSADSHVFRIFNLLWYAASFAGIVWLYLAWEQWWNAAHEPALQASGRGKWIRAVLAGMVMIPIELTHHLVHGPAGLLLIIGYALTLLTGVVWWLGKFNGTK